MLSKHPLLHRFLVIIGSLFFSLLLCEGLYRVFIHRKINTISTAKKFFETDPKKLPAGLSSAPLANIPLTQHRSDYIDYFYNVQSNNLGLIQQKDYNGEDNIIYLLGDSFGAGALADIDKNYAAELSKGLPSYTVLNLSVNSYSTFDEYYRLLDIAGKIKSNYHKKGKYVILHFYMGNDFMDNIGYYKRATYSQNRGSDHPTVFSPKESLIIFLRKYSHLFRYMYASLRRTGFLSKKGPYGMPIGYEFRDSDIVLLKYLEDFDFKPTAIALTDLIGYCEKEGMGLAVVIIPNQNMSSKTLRAQIQKIFGPKDTQFDTLRYQLRDFLAKRGVFFVDLTDYFLSLRNSEKLYVPYDGHWNQFGQKISAKYVLDRVIKQLPSATPKHAH